MSKTYKIFGLVIASVSLLTGCSSQAGAVVPTTPVQEVERKAVAVLQERVGIQPDLECEQGTSNVELRDGEHVSCVLTDPQSGKQYPVNVIIRYSDAESDYTVEAEIVS